MDNIISVLSLFYESSVSSRFTANPIFRQLAVILADLHRCYKRPPKSIIRPRQLFQTKLCLAKRRDSKPSSCRPLSKCLRLNAYTNTHEFHQIKFPRSRLPNIEKFTEILYSSWLKKISLIHVQNRP